jgi:hypothetical protein
MHERRVQLIWLLFIAPTTHVRRERLNFQPRPRHAVHAGLAFLASMHPTMDVTTLPTHSTWGFPNGFIA